MSTHVLKILPKYFAQIRFGNKTFEIRRNDRNFKSGDVVELHEHLHDRFTGEKLERVIGYICDYEQKVGYVVFSLLEKNTYSIVRTKKALTIDE